MGSAFDHIANQMLTAGDTMEDNQDDPLLLEICHHLLKAGIGFRQWAQSVSEDEVAHIWALTRAEEVQSLADYINPPKPCWPPNVVPFRPRQVG